MRSSLSVSLGAMLGVLVGGCIQTVPRGPDLGACAEVPDEGSYTFGDIGIGTCLAGPADLEFFTQDGRAWLAVSNADPYRNFVTGSLLAIDFDEVAQRIETDRANGSVGPTRIFLDDTVATSLPIFDDDAIDEDDEGTNPFLGGIGRPSERALVVAGRLTEGADVRSGRDELFVVDTSGLPGELTLADEFFLRDDPFPVVVDPDSGITYVGNITDHSISLVEPVDDPSVPAGEEIEFEPTDASSGQGVGPAVLDDVDGSGSLIELGLVQQTSRRAIDNDLFTLTYVSGTRRLYVPTALDEGGTGIVRWDSGDGRTYGVSSFGPEQGCLDAECSTAGSLQVEGQPFLALDADNQPLLVFAADETGQDGLRQFTLVAQPTIGLGGKWSIPSAILSGEPGQRLASPVVIGRDGGQTLYVAVQDVEGGPFRIRRADDPDAQLTFGTPTDTLPDPGPDVSQEDPFLFFDQRARRFRMWFTELDLVTGTRRIMHAASFDGETFEVPTVVLDDVANVAAPVVTVIDASYEMYLARDNGDGYDLALASSPDGLSWSEPTVVISDVAGADGPPPRAGLLFQVRAAFRVDTAVPSNLNPIPAGAGGRASFAGFDISVVHGHEVSNDVVAQVGEGSPHAKRALLPGSIVEIGGRTLLYATAVDGPDPTDDALTSVGCRTPIDQTRRIVVLEENPAGEWQLVNDGFAMDEMLGIGAGQDAFSPAAYVENGRVVLVFAIEDPDRTFLARATSTNGVTFARPNDDIVEVAPEAGGFDGAGRLPRTLEATEDGVRLWYTADDGITCTVGTLLATSARDVFEPESAGPVAPLGGVNAFDADGMKDPAPFTIDDVRYLIYAGERDGIWRLGILRDDPIEGWVRDDDPLSAVAEPVAPGVLTAFSAFGTDSPAMMPTGGSLLYAGYDGIARRTGYARISVVDGRPGVYPELRHATSPDTLTFATERLPSRDGFPATVIELAQTNTRFSTDGEGMAGLTLDRERGFLYITSKVSTLGVSDRVTVVDVRDDSSANFLDANYLDLEGVVEVDLALQGIAGFRTSLVDPVRNVLYLTMTEPDGVAVVDLGAFVDDAEIERRAVTAAGVLPLPNLGNDQGAETFRTFIGGAGMALAPDQRTLLVTHFTGNAVALFDLDLGAFGEQVGWLPNIGENPHVVEVSPDGRYAVVANYVGDVDDNLSSGTLVVIDVDPTSPSFREVVAWIGNR